MTFEDICRRLNYSPHLPIYRVVNKVEVSLCRPTLILHEKWIIDQASQLMMIDFSGPIPRLAVHCVLGNHSMVLDGENHDHAYRWVVRLLPVTTPSFRQLVGRVLDVRVAVKADRQYA